MSELTKRLQAVIQRDTGLEVSEPVSYNRGYWRSYPEAYRWRVKGPDGEMIFGWPSMAECAAAGVELIGPSHPLFDGEVELIAKGLRLGPSGRSLPGKE